MKNEKIEHIRQWLGTGSINIFGRPFAGKDTVCQKLADVLGGVVLGGGDILRNSVIPPHVKTAIDAGQLAPTEEYIGIVLPYLSKEEFKGKPLILSSVGRWIGEEEGVIRATKDSGHQLKTAIYLDISDDIAHKRWQIAHSSDKRGRLDDEPGKLEKRFDEFTDKTLPVINEYEKMGLLLRVNGDQSPDDVFTSVLDLLARHTDSISQV